MANDPTYDRLIEASWRRDLTPAEQSELRAWLAQHPEAQAQWEAEAALNDVLVKLPSTPVATNFTARVLQAVEREVVATGRRTAPGWLVWQWWPRWLPKAAFAALVLGAGLFSYHKVQAARRAEIAWSVATVSGVSSLPSAETLKDFDAIWALDQSPPADEELLTLFK